MHPRSPLPVGLDAWTGSGDRRNHNPSMETRPMSFVTTGAMIVSLDGDLEEADKVHNRGSLPEIEIGRREYILAPSTEVAGDAVRDRWRELKENDKSEFRALIGAKRLIAWGCDESDEFGISSWEEFLDRAGGTPEDELAVYDSREIDARVNLFLADAIGWDNTDDAGLDAEALASAIAGGGIDIPEGIAAQHPDIDPTDGKAWVPILLAHEFPEEDGPDTLEILNTFRFVPCVAYRSN